MGAMLSTCVRGNGSCSAELGGVSVEADVPALDDRPARCAVERLPGRSRTEKAHRGTVLGSPVQNSPEQGAAVAAAREPGRRGHTPQRDRVLDTSRQDRGHGITVVLKHPELGEELATEGPGDYDLDGLAVDPVRLAHQSADHQHVLGSPTPHTRIRRSGSGGKID